MPTSRGPRSFWKPWLSEHAQSFGVSHTRENFRLIPPSLEGKAARSPQKGEVTTERAVSTAEGASPALPCPLSLWQRPRGLPGAPASVGVCLGVETLMLDGQAPLRGQNSQAAGQQHCANRSLGVGQCPPRGAEQGLLPETCWVQV